MQKIKKVCMLIDLGGPYGNLYVLVINVKWKLGHSCLIMDVKKRLRE